MRESATVPYPVSVSAQKRKHDDQGKSMAILRQWDTAHDYHLRSQLRLDSLSSPHAPWLTNAAYNPECNVQRRPKERRK